MRQRHVVRLETRPPNIEGKGAVRQRQLVINALRMRPDRIIVGEVRGEEALDMLQAMNTGHDGSLTTIHANSPRDALYRLDTMIAMANLNIPDKAVRQQVASAVNLVIQVTRLADGTRRVTSISEITGMEQDVIAMQEIFSFQQSGIDKDGKVIGASGRPAFGPKCADKLATAGMPLPMDMFSHAHPVNEPRPGAEALMAARRSHVCRHAAGHRRRVLGLRRPARGAGSERALAPADLEAARQRRLRTELLKHAQQLSTVPAFDAVLHRSRCGLCARSRICSTQSGTNMTARHVPARLWRCARGAGVRRSVVTRHVLDARCGVAAASCRNAADLRAAHEAHAADTASSRNSFLKRWL